MYRAREREIEKRIEMKTEPCVTSVLQGVIDDLALHIWANCLLFERYDLN